MTFLLNSQNVSDYLIESRLCSQEEVEKIQIELKPAKNFNLLITLQNNRKLLVKQELLDRNGKSSGEFLGEQKIQKIFTTFPELNFIDAFLPKILHFDAENSIMVLKYLDDYQDLMEFYTKEQIFSEDIASAIGYILATIHRCTFNKTEYKNFLSEKVDNSEDNYNNNLVSYIIRRLERIEPEIYSSIPADSLRFFTLYQKYDSLGKALTDLADSVVPCCLIHNDLKLNNILVKQLLADPNWQQLVTHDNQDSKNHQSNIIRLIDWERCAWGDPAFDLGMLIGSYIQLWLGSLVISKSLSLEESLTLAMIPIEKLQPSIAQLTLVYLQTFPDIVEHRTDFLLQVMRFIGFSLIQAIQAMIQYKKSFGNSGIAMLQVAKSLLCRPEESMPTIFGANFFTDANLLIKQTHTLV
ncbi:phosphotransferase [Calothrix sp. PCC 6303]|uniref:phosphotransferase n=1 Tax=Calothrix sp. PCC 6303 TaxID=1170562 RepID=UPI0002A0241D|nr:phosphotransferase [Calothrix sp. PCC 6303]AFZ01493.1 Choline/ethanolamine kinase [Calothrix sp. PCC 6303]